MCGIGGILSRDGGAPEAVAERMVSRLPHRGPDSDGIYASGPIALAHTRLRILDLSSAGAQPMSNASEDVHIVFNGEIYNYRELRDRVSQRSFRSETDTEVLLALYEELGIDCLGHLRGMFAFAIWDERRNRLFLARDRLGQKPLFYRHTEDAFVFGSTIGAILADDAVAPKPDPRAIRSYLTYQYVPSPRTGFETIRQVNPGEYLSVSGDEITRETYWQPSFADQFDDPPSTLADRLETELRDAVRLRMRSDVPLGVFLSGGIDSSVVTALMAEMADEAVQTYSIGFDVDRFDELTHARTVAETFGTDHTEHRLTPDTLLDSLSDLLDHFQMPLGDPSILPTYHVSRLAAADITVALTGDGGDESLAGYDRYRRDRLVSKLTRVPAPVRKAGRGLLDAVPGPARTHRFVRLPRRALEIADPDPVRRYAGLTCHAIGEDAARLWNGPVPSDELEVLRSTMDAADGPTRLDTMLYTDLELNLPDRLLVKIDRASMAHSLEVRSPFLDHEFVEFAAKVPAKYKLKGSTGKWLLKEAFADTLPDEILDRPKRGFGTPVNVWTRGRLRELATETLSRLGDRSLFHQEGLSTLLDQHLSRRRNHGNVVWDLIVLEQWFERYID